MARQTLQPGYRLHWYVIEKVLGQGGFGITYLAGDTNLNQRVAIKEYLPSELAQREEDDSVHPVSGEYGEQFSWGLERFIKEAQTLARFKHPHIVRVLTVFTDNNTAYMVMEYEEGEALHDRLKQQKTLSEQEQLSLLFPLLDGLEKVHQLQFIHRDIKPANIYVRQDGSPVLLDFGSARQALSQQTQTLTTMVSPGYAPFEQYVSKSDKQGPWTDIYGLAATLYRATIGRSPPNAVDRSESILHTGQDLLVPAAVVKPDGYSLSFLQAIDRGLGFRAEDRPQTITDWRQNFSQATIDPADVTATEPLTPSASEAETELADSEPQKTFQVDPSAMSAGTVQTDTVANPPSFFRRLWQRIKTILKWLAILWLVLVILSVLGKRNKHAETDLPAEVETNTETAVQPAPAGQQEVITGEKPAPVMVETDPTSAKIGDLLQAADNDIRSYRLTTPADNNAVEKYAQVLQLDPTNTEARSGMRRVAETYLHLMHKALNQNDIAAAGQYLDKAGQVDPLHPALAEARRHLDAQLQAEETRQKNTEMEDSNRRPLMDETERNTIQRIQKTLEEDPDNKSAQRQARRMAKNFERKVKKAVEAGQYELAEEYVLEAIELAPDNKGLQEALEKIRQARARLDR